MNGMPTYNDMCFLKVKGVSQLEKEIEETRNMPNKVVDMNALHRNEITHEVEGEEDN